MTSPNSNIVKVYGKTQKKCLNKNELTNLCLNDSIYGEWKDQNCPNGNRTSITTGTYQESDGQTQCKLCNQYMDSVDGLRCEGCQTGYEIKTKNDIPKPCKKGWFQPYYAVNDMSYPKCTEEYKKGSDNKELEGQPCYLNLNKPSDISKLSCSACPLGTHSHSKREDGTMELLNMGGKCDLCPPGTYQNKVGGETCKPCKFGDYQDKSGSTKCKLCPEGHYCPDETP